MHTTKSDVRIPRAAAVVAALVASWLLGCAHGHDDFATLTVDTQCNPAFSHQAIVSYDVPNGTPGTRIEVRLQSNRGDDLILPLAQAGPRGRVAIPLAQPQGGDIKVEVEAVDPISGARTTASSGRSLVACRRPRRPNESLTVGVVLLQNGADAAISHCLDQALRQAATAQNVTLITLNATTLKQRWSALKTLSRRSDVDALIVYVGDGDSRLRRVIEAVTRKGIPVYAFGSIGGGATGLPLPEKDCHVAGQTAIRLANLGNRRFADSPFEGDYGLSLDPPTDPSLPPDPFPTCKFSGMLGSYEVVRPIVSSVEPSKIPMTSSGSVTVRGKFGASAVDVVLMDGSLPVPVGRLPVERASDGVEFVRFTLPRSVEGKRYRIAVETGAYRRCQSTQPVFLDVEAPAPNRKWYVAALENVTVRDDLDGTAGEARFVLGGKSRTANTERLNQVTFPAGAFITIWDGKDSLFFPRQFTDSDEEAAGSTTIAPNAPFLWEPLDTLGDEVGFTIGAVENDPSTSAPDWAKPLIEALATAVGCWVGEGIDGCKSGYEIGERLGNGLEEWAKSGGDTSFGAIGDTCPKSLYYCLGSSSNQTGTRPYNIPASDSDPKLMLNVRFRQTDGPRLEDLRVSLLRVKLLNGYGRGPLNIYLIYRVTPLSFQMRRLNPHGFEPAGAPDVHVFELCPEGWDRCEAPSEKTYSPPKRLYPAGDEAPPVLAEPNGIPAVHIEISAWEDKGGGEQQLLGITSEIVWLGDLLDNRLEWRDMVTKTVYGLTDLDGGRVDMGPTAVELRYEVYARRRLTP